MGQPTGPDSADRAGGGVELVRGDRAPLLEGARPGGVGAQCWRGGAVLLVACIPSCGRLQFAWASLQ